MQDGSCPACAAPGQSSPEQSLRPGQSVVSLFKVIGAGILLILIAAGSLAYHSLKTLNQRRAMATKVEVKKGNVARLDQLNGNGRIYLVHIGKSDTPPYSLEELANWLRTKYSLEVEVLKWVRVDESAFDSARKQYVAELLYEQIKRAYPVLATERTAYLFGFTDQDMYSPSNGWNFNRAHRFEPKGSIVSSARLEESFLESIGNDKEEAKARLHKGLRRLLLKTVAMLYWQLPLNNDPTSIVRHRLNPDLPVEDIYESDLEPTRYPWGQYEGEPCIFFSYSAKEGMKRLPGRLIRTCSEDKDVQLDESTELFEVDLGLGLLTDNHKDFIVPDTIPLEFTRVTRDGWKGPMGFGISGSHSYDKYLAADNMRLISVIHPDGGTEDLDRVPAWLDYLPWVKYVDGDYSGRYYEMKWQTKPFERFDLKRYDGYVESFLPCDGKELCYLIRIVNAHGDKVGFERNKDRSLKRVVSPNKSELRFSYDKGNRIAEIEDSRGRKVSYGYDDRGRLINVSYPSGEIFHYEYDDTQHLLTFSVQADTQSAPTVLMRNEYEKGLLVKQTFSNGDIYSYSYDPMEAKNIRSATVGMPDGKVYDIEIDGTSTVRERGVGEEKRQ
jgi:YD repeat-containing protein